MKYIILLAIFSCAYPVSAETLLLRLCGKSDCGPAESGPHRAMVFTSGIDAVQDSIDCPGQCSNVVMSGKVNTLHVTGHWLDIACKTWAGDFCAWDTSVISKDEVIELMLKATGGEE